MLQYVENETGGAATNTQGPDLGKKYGCPHKNVRSYSKPDIKRAKVQCSPFEQITEYKLVKVLDGERLFTKNENLLFHHHT